MSQAAAIRPPGGDDAADDPGLVREVGRFALVALSINSIIGSGIFGLPARVHAMIGPWALAAYVICAVVVFLVALCFAEVASRFTRTGGPYLYATRAFGATTGFAVGWLTWLTRVSAGAAICQILADYMAHFVPAAASGPGRAITIALAVGATTWVNLTGIRRAAGTATVFAVAKVAPLVLLGFVGLFFVDLSAFRDAPPPATASLSQATLVLIFAFVGFETTTIAAGEARRPTRDLPFALIASLCVATVIYLAVQVVCVGVVPDLASSARPLADAAAVIAGPGGAALIAAAAVVSTSGTMLAGLITAPRILFAMGVEDRLPAVLARTHPTWRTPDVAILVTSATVLGLALSGAFVHLATLSVIARLAAYVATALALPVFRRRVMAPPAFRLRAAWLVVLLTCALCAWLVTTSALTQLRDVALATGAGLLLYAAHAARRRARAR